MDGSQSCKKQQNKSSSTKMFGDYLQSQNFHFQKDDSVSIHTINFRFLAVEMFKVAKSTAPNIFSNLFL